MNETLKKIILRIGPRKRRLLIQIYRIFHLLRYRKFFSQFIEFRGVKLKVGKDVSIFPSLLSGKYEKSELDLLLSYAFKSNTVFWDVGANIGIYSILFAKTYPSWKIFAFEPNSEIESLLRDNINKNLSNNIEVVALALSSKSSTKLLKLNRYRAGGNNLIDSSCSGGKVLEVVATKGDELVYSKKIPRPDFIKIDCEWHELEILTGLKDTIFNFRPIVSIEILRENWSNLESFILFIGNLNSLVNLYGNAILIKNNKLFKITQIAREDLDNSLQTLVLGFR